MRIDPSKMEDAKVSTPWGWAVALALKCIGATGNEVQGGAARHASQSDAERLSATWQKQAGVEHAVVLKRGLELADWILKAQPDWMEAQALRASLLQASQ